jgi:hypothetical protein
MRYQKSGKIEWDWRLDEEDDDGDWCDGGYGSGKLWPGASAVEAS